MDDRDIFEASEQEKKALSRRRIFYALLIIDSLMVALLLWEIVELFLK